MDSTPYLSRYQPAVLTVVAAAAGYGIYLLYTSTSTQQQPTPSLHRSNAIHRPRRERHLWVIDHVPPTPDAPLGVIVIRGPGDTRHSINLATMPMPTVEQLSSLQYISDAEKARRDLEDEALGNVLAACHIATHNTDHWRQLEELGFRELLVAMEARDQVEVRLLSRQIPRLLHLNDIGMERVAQAAHAFLMSPRWREGSELGSEDDGVDPAETEDLDVLNASDREPSQGLRGLLYYIAEEDAMRKAYEHRGIHCEECGEQPIRGIRWHCLNCPDFDLCSSCEQGTQHPKTHVFAKIKIPLPVLSQPAKEFPLWYPGDPHRIHRSLDPALKKALCQEHGFEEPQLDAFYDQFICVANVPHPIATASVDAAIDRRAFNKAMTCEKWPQRFAANAIYDRMFFFYDTDGNGIIDFGEFVSGMAYLRGPKRYASMTRVISGYDMDGDGFVERSDVLRLLRAKYDIQKQLVNDMIQGQEADMSLSSIDILRSNQPISSIFAQEDIPPGERRPARGKIIDGFGDMQPLQGQTTILDDEESWPGHFHFTSRAPRTRRTSEQLRALSSRFEELLHSADEQLNTFDVPDERTGMWDGPSLDRLDGISDEEDDMEDENMPPRNHLPREPHVQDIVWELAQQGMQELLDMIFLERERRDKESATTARDRIRWREEIDAEKKAQEAERLAREADPLVATALSASQAPQATAAATSSSPSPSDDIVPTDWQSLERRELEIPEKPLEELLSTTGYSVRDDPTPETENSPPRMAHTGSSSIWNRRRQDAASSPLSMVVSSVHDPTPDPTLPQNRPNEPKKALRRSRGKSVNSEPRVPTQHTGVPTKARLRYLAEMDEVEREVEERGGMGRLSYAEVEAIAKAEGRGEVDGLIRSWLEWASF